MFDTHAHLNFKDFDQDRDHLITKAREKNLKIINVGTSYKESVKVVEIAEKHPTNTYATVGLHPLYLQEEWFEEDKYLALAESKQVVAIGETGLDYKYIEKDEALQRQQKRVFREHLALAKKTNLPVVIHCRRAHEEMISFLKKTDDYGGKGVLHSFTGKKRDVKEYLDLGLFLGINGIIFKMDIDKALREIPLERMLLETDCPFLSPVEGVKRNEPMLVEKVAERVSEVKGVSKEEVLRVTTENAENLFLKKLK